MIKAYTLISLFVLAACGPLPPSPREITAFNGSSVTVSQINLAGEGNRSAATDADAQKICATEDKQAQYASGQYKQGKMYHFYLCI